MDNITAASPAAPTPTPPAVPTALPPGSYRQELTPTESDTMVGWIKDDLAKGKMSPDQATKAFDDLKASPEQRAPDTRSEDERTLDRLSPVAKPEEYLIQYDHLDPLKPIPNEVRAFDTAARTWLSDAGTPREIGNSLVHAVDRAAKATGHMSDAECEHYGNAQYTILEKTYGADLEKKLQRAGEMVQELEKKTPGLNALLKSGIGDNAIVASLLIQQSEIYWARKGQGGSHA